MTENKNYENEINITSEELEELQKIDGFDGSHKKPTMPDLEELLDLPEGDSLEQLALEGDEAEAEALSENEALQAEIDDLKDKLVRTLAESENVRKRAQRDRRDAEIYGGQKLARDLLSLYDNLERALSAIDDDLKEKAAAVVEGLELTKTDLLNTFAKHQIMPITPEIGEKFDPQIHQAMFEAPVPDIEAGHIIQVMSSGFMIADRLLRPADVGVAR